MDNTLNVAYYVVSKYDDITPLKLQKLLYYLKVWGLIAGKNLFDGNFEKWPHGPVNARVYHKFKEFQSEPITLPPWLKFNDPFKGEEKVTADFILDCYAQYSGGTLSAMSHADLPWRNTQTGKMISEKIMRSFYSCLLFAKNFPFDAENKPFYPVPTDTHYAFAFDMNQKDAVIAQVFPSFKEYKAMQEATSRELQILL